MVHGGGDGGGGSCRSLGKTVLCPGWAVGRWEGWLTTWVERDKTWVESQDRKVAGAD